VNGISGDAAACDYFLVPTSTICDATFDADSYEWGRARSSAAKGAWTSNPTWTAASF
jgi:hypothetical protein